MKDKWKEVNQKSEYKLVPVTDCLAIYSDPEAIKKPAESLEYVIKALKNIPSFNEKKDQFKSLQVLPNSASPTTVLPLDGVLKRVQTAISILGVSAEQKRILTSANVIPKYLKNFYYDLSVCSNASYGRIDAQNSSVIYIRRRESDEKQWSVCTLEKSERAQSYFSNFGVTSCNNIVVFAFEGTANVSDAQRGL